MTIGNFSKVIGTEGADDLFGSDLEILYGLAGLPDTLTTVEGSLTVLVGGSGIDIYQRGNNSTSIIIENGNSRFDYGPGLRQNSLENGTFFSLEIDNGRHLFFGDTESNRYSLLIDWRVPENRIESFGVRLEDEGFGEGDNGPFGYDLFNDMLFGTSAYLGSFTWEEALALEELQGKLDLERLGLSPETIDDAIALVKIQSAALESRDSIGNFSEIVGSEGDDNILGSDLQILYGLEGNDTLYGLKRNDKWAPFYGPNASSSNTFLVGGAGDDRYRVGDFFTRIIETGNSDNDVVQATGIGLNKESSYSLEVDNGRHLLVMDLESSQSTFLIDWQVPEHRIETFELEDGTFSYQDVVDNFRSSPGYVGSFTWEEFFDLSSETVNEEIVQVNARASDLEARDPITGQIVYRFFNTSAGNHFYTTDVGERDYIVDHLDNYNFEGASCKAADPLTGSPVPVYRFFNRRSDAHFYTIDEGEKDFIIDNLDHFVFEGEKFWAYQEGIDSTIPIYRFYEPSLGVHFYTPSEAEKDFVEENLTNYDFEGIAYYAHPVDFI